MYCTVANKTPFHHQGRKGGLARYHLATAAFQLLLSEL